MKRATPEEELCVGGWGGLKDLVFEKTLSRLERGTSISKKTTVHGRRSA